VHPSRNLGRTGRRGLPDGATGSSLPALRGEPEQVRQIDALLEFLDPLAELIASTRRIGMLSMRMLDPGTVVSWHITSSSAAVTAPGVGSGRYCSTAANTQSTTCLENDVTVCIRRAGTRR